MRRRSIIVVVLMSAAVVLPAVHSSAVKPDRGCPPPFEMKTTAEALVLLNEEFHPEATPEENEAFIDAIDANDDENVCLQRGHTHGKFPDNWVDNTSNH